MMNQMLNMKKMMASFEVMMAAMAAQANGANGVKI
jgi:hypothetical protein